MMSNSTTDYDETMSPMVKVFLAATAVAALGWLGISQLQPRTTLDSRGCDPLHPSALTVRAVDRSDQLVPDNDQSVAFRRAHAIADLSVGSRLSIIPIGGEDTAEPVPVFDRCLATPGTNRFTAGATADADARADFASEAATKTNGLDSEGATARSELIEQLAAIAASPAFSMHQRRTLVVETDLLENRTGSSVYLQGPTAVKPPPGMPFTGWAVRLEVMTNLRDRRLQTDDLVNAWASALIAGGAKSVTISRRGALDYVVNGQPPKSSQ